ncbi:MAG: DoxX family protein [Bacteroidales bacterium]|nr:DoxX family protein [Bacteroidales bacterium]MCF8344208.1 DoxX family protein [Bacteroidales bacterium]MCF8352693.1 DoxX family protein [Bacteroidales bacterium]MCF8375079.1 DoxX family protein [Bacteroidales bacterium]MCF8399985.1 DoxX family protein [Bacteroidales bacterium]
MNLRGKTFHKIDVRITKWMASTGLTLLRWSIGIIFLWFGVLKFFEGLSPAQDLAIRTIGTLTFGLVPENIIIYGLATWEVLIGVGLLFNIFIRETLLLLYLQMIGTFLPVFFFPSEVFKIFPYSLTLEGQYIFKNLVVISSGIVLGATVRGGELKPNIDPDKEKEIE